MGFAKIGAWLDNKMSGANQAWQNSGTKQTVDSVAAKTKQVVTDTADKVSISATDARENFGSNMAEVNAKTEGKGFFSKAMEVGKSGGLVGMAMKKPAGAAEEAKPEKPAEAPATPPPLPKKGIMDDVKEVAGAIKEIVTGDINNVKEVAGAVKEVVTEDVNSVKAVAGKAADYVKDTVRETAAKIPTTTTQAKDNFKANMAEVNEETKGQSFLGKMWKVGMSGGLVGMMKNRPEEKKEPKPVEQHNGWNVK